MAASSEKIRTPAQLSCPRAHPCCPLLCQRQEECAATARKLGRDVFAFNLNSHHCFAAACSMFTGVMNDHVTSGCRPALSGCGSPAPSPAPSPPSPGPHPPAPPSGPARFVPHAAATFTMGRNGPQYPAIVDVVPAGKSFSPGFLSYDEQPAHHVSLPAFEVMTEPVVRACHPSLPRNNPPT